jgi:predicted transcriptional regulator
LSPGELRSALRDLRITPYRLAKTAGVDTSTVYKWLKPGATVPGYVITIIRMMRELEELRERLAADR